MPPPDVDPLLLLAILDDLTGRDDVRDGRIASLFAKGDAAGVIHTENLFVLDLKYLLASQLKARVHARRMLAEMAVKANSDKLVAAVWEIDSEAVKGAEAARPAEVGK